MHRAPVLEQQGSRDRRIAGVGINGRPVLRGVQEDFGELAILEPANASGVPNAAMLEVDQLVPASVR
jgi:hypothetical protein